MVNSNRNKKNQPPTGEVKHQSPFTGEPRKLGKRSDVVQAQRGHPELNLGDSDEETASLEGDQPNPNRPKAAADRRTPPLVDDPSSSANGRSQPGSAG